MRILIFAIALLLLPVFPHPILAQNYDPIGDLLKDYCNTTSNIEKVDHTNVDSTVFMKKPFINENNLDTNKAFFTVKEMEVKKSGTDIGVLIPVNKTFPMTVGGPLTFTPPQLFNFIKQQTQNSTASTPFDIKVSQEMVYTDPVDKNFKTINTREAKCALQKQTALIVQPPLIIRPPLPSPAPVPASPPPAPPHFIKYCDPANTKLETAVGCIPVNNTTEFTTWFLKWAIGIAGGIAFLLMVIASFQIMTASGSPEKLQGGREMLTAAISGLILIIFSVFLLKLIGVEILQIPGL